MREGPAIDPRTVFKIAAGADGAACLNSLKRYLPFSRTAAFDEGVPKSFDWVRSMKRAALFGQAEELARLAHKALSVEQDYPFTDGGRWTFWARSSSERRNELHGLSLVEENDAILRLIESLQPKADEVGSGDFLRTHHKRYLAVRKELEQLRNSLAENQ